MGPEVGVHLNLQTSLWRCEMDSLSVSFILCWPNASETLNSAGPGRGEDNE